MCWCFFGVFFLFGICWVFGVFCWSFILGGDGGLVVIFLDYLYFVLLFDLLTVVKETSQNISGADLTIN